MAPVTFLSPLNFSLPRSPTLSMAGTILLRPVLCLLPSTRHSNGTHPLPGISHLKRNPNSSIRYQSPPRSSPQANPSPKKNPVAEPEPCVQRDKNSNPPARFFPLFESFSHLLGRIGKELKADDIGLDIISIALPAVLALAADPIASLVDTAFVGHLGSVELAAVGVSCSVFNLVSKLFNVPLLNITTSFVAEEQALDRECNNEKALASESILPGAVNGGYAQGKKFLPAVSTSLVLAAGIGILEAILLLVGSGPLLNFMGIAVDSPMRTPAEQFLTVRALGAPPTVIALAAQGTFRGFMDTKTPLYAVGAGNILNAILDMILIFLIGLGIGGAAIATVTSEYVIACILLWKLNMKVRLISPNIDGRGVVRYLKSGALLIGRTIAVLATMTLATSIAARHGPIPMAGHQICLQVWLAVSLLNDALALAGQALLASAYNKGNYKQAQAIIYKVLQIGLITGTALAILLFLGFGAFSSIFTTDASVLEIARSGILFVTISQPVNALAFVVDGLYYGVSDFEYAAYSMMLVGLVSSMFLLSVAPVFGLPGVWTGLLLFMTLRVVAGFYRLNSKSGPWKMVWSEMLMVEK